MLGSQDFWQLTEDGLVYAAKALGLELTSDARARLLQSYLSLAAFPDVKPGLEALKGLGLQLAILSNGEPKMLQAAAQSAGILGLLDRVISVEEVKVFKPSPGVYNLAPERLGVRNAELGFVFRSRADPRCADRRPASRADRLRRPRSGRPVARARPSPLARPWTAEGRWMAS